MISRKRNGTSLICFSFAHFVELHSTVASMGSFLTVLTHYHFHGPALAYNSIICENFVVFVCQKDRKLICESFVFRMWIKFCRGPLDSTSFNHQNVMNGRVNFHHKNGLKNIFKKWLFKSFSPQRNIHREWLSLLHISAAIFKVIANWLCS